MVRSTGHSTWPGRSDCRRHDLLDLVEGLAGKMSQTDGDDVHNRQQQGRDDCGVLVCLLAGNSSEANCHHHHYRFEKLLLRSVIKVCIMFFFSRENFVPLVQR